ncbi:MAG: carboxymuconolactone decarboxylase family protein [Gemmatimonadaceae bacterium]|nr:carboxymuconolactone decarboxylase family protein [Gemmatimonadaceae bacterium]
MTSRIANPYALAPEMYKAMVALENTVKNCGLEYSLIELIKMRVSQINGCAFCLHMHATELEKLGEHPMRIHLLPAWREATAYTPRERAALGWAEAITLIAQTQAPDADYNALAAEFTEAEQMKLTVAIGAINVWNRLQVGFRGTNPELTIQHAASHAA